MSNINVTAARDLSSAIHWIAKDLASAQGRAVGTDEALALFAQADAVVEQLAHSAGISRVKAATQLAREYWDEVFSLDKNDPIQAQLRCSLMEKAIAFRHLYEMEINAVLHTA